MKEKYKISLIVYCQNSEKYIGKCIDSLVKQTIGIKNLQIILIDDGSTDNSFELCKKFMKKYSNIEYYNQKHTGVCSARNNGLDRALGKYIVFLNANDYLSMFALKKLYYFFEKHYNEIDLVSYSIIYDNDGKLIRKKDYFNYQTGIYDLEKNPHFNQSTVNVMVKNNKSLPRFDINMKFAEDQNFNTMILCHKKKIGFVRSAIYYRKSLDEVSNTYNTLFNCYESIYGYFEKLLNKNNYKDKKIPKFVMSNIVNTIGWRMSANQLFLNHLKGKEKEVMMNGFISILNNIDDDIISSNPSLNEIKKYYLFILKGYNLDVKIDNGKYKICNDKNVLLSNDGVNLEFREIKFLNDGKVELLGVLNTCLFDKIKPDLYIWIDGKRQIVDLDNSTFGYVNSNLKCSNMYKFDMDLNICNIKEIRFSLFLNRKEVNVKTLFCQPDINKFYSKKLCLKLFSNGIIKIYKNCKIKTIFNILFQSMQLRLQIAKIYKILALIKRNKKTVWLYSDSRGILDNAYYQFKHDIKKNDGIDRYYVIYENESNFEKIITKKEKEHLIRFKTLKQKLLFLNCDKYFCSFSNISNYSPFGKSIVIYKDIIKHQVIYMQHGVLHANLKKMYAKESSHISKVVISTNFEKTNFVNNYSYRKEDLIPYGMPRLFIEEKNVNLKNKILIALSWREYLVGNIINNKRKEKRDEFINSNYYKKVISLLNNSKLNEFLSDNNIEIDFKPHPNFKCYSDLFIINSKNININYDKTILQEYKIFITDFSSYQFDFIKLNRPIIYFMPDMEEFEAGLHTYSELDLKYEDAFGNLFFDEDKLVGEIIRLYNNKCKVDNKYLKKMKNFYIKNDNKCCEKIYNMILNE